jgi:F-type H+-transporting ATPase subunit a
MRLSTDEIVFWQHGFAKLNATILWTWVLMLIMVIGARLITKRLKSEIHISRRQNVLEIIVLGILKQIKDIGVPHPEKYVAFIGTIFLFIAMAALCTIFPVYEPPTGSLSTTAALAICAFLAVPLFGIEDRGFWGFLKTYLEPTPLMLPFNVIGEISRTLALAIRLFGNVMSGTMILGILLVITPFVFPIVMTLLGLLVGMVQAYIFSIITTVFIAAAVKSAE